MNIETARKSYYDYWHGMTKIYEDWAQKYHMSGNSMFILQIIWEYSGKVTQKDICEALLLPKPVSYTHLLYISRDVPTFLNF